MSGATRVGNIILGNCIGKGAFGSVWRGLNLDTATTVAVKQINLSDIPSAELANIMMEIDLLKKLNHANIVKYLGFEKTTDYLNIILELCENGSLRSLCKNFGKLPEHLGAMYITQVLDGLVYLHDQGVIHRDIKGANILATKDGLVKLADFGVATLTNDVGDMSVAGTPYWMAPEIIELSGATTASDIWSVGCTVIELLDGEPPYHDLAPMGALYRIVQDDHPPIPDSVSAIVRDFLMQCFQKDCNLRVSAKKLSKHPWIQMSKKKASGSQRSREKAIPAYDEAVKSVQQWNEALKGSTISSARNSMSHRRASIDKGGRSWEQSVPAMTDLFHAPKPQGKLNLAAMDLRQERPMIPPSHFHLPNNTSINPTNTNNYEPEVCTDNWDDDFAEGISSIQLAAREFRDQEDEVSRTIRPVTTSYRPLPVPLQPAVPENDVDEDDFEDEGEDLRIKIKVKALENKKRAGFVRQESVAKAVSGSLASRTKAVSHAPIDLVRSRSAPGQLALSPPPIAHEFQHYREDDEDDFSDLFEDGQGVMYQDEGLMLQTRLSNHSWFGNDAGSDEEDPFAEVDEGFDEIDLEANIAREKYARIWGNIAEQFKLLEHQRTEKQLETVCDRLMTLLSENPDMRGSMIANHGAIPLLDLIETSTQQSLILKLLTILNLVIRNDYALQESLCLVGAIPVLIRFTSKRYGKEIQGLRVLIDFLQGSYTTRRDLVWIAINGIHSVFNLQSLTPRNDFCRLLAKQGLLDPLSATLYNTIRDPAGAPFTEKIVQVLLIFSQGDSPVKELLATRQIVHRMLVSLQSLPANLCVMMLKCIKNISMNSNTLDVLQNASAIHTLVQVLGERTGAVATDVSNHVLTTLFNLCRINKSRQVEAAQAGIVPHLQQIAESSSPSKQFALPVLCDMAHAGRICRNILWNNDTLPVYLRLFKDPYWQVNAMDSVLVWLQDETADVEQILLEPGSLNLFVQAFLTAKANSFENILEPFYKIIRISPPVACGIAVPALFQRLLDRLAHPKAVVRLNLLRILRAIFDVHPERLQLVVRYGIADVVAKMAEGDSAVLVMELARDILKAFEESDSEAMSSHGGGSSEGDQDSMNGVESLTASKRDFLGLAQPLPILAAPLTLTSIKEWHGTEEADRQDGHGSEQLRNGGRQRSANGEGSDGGTPLQQNYVAKFKDLKQEEVEPEDIFEKQVEELGVQARPELKTISSRQMEWNRAFGSMSIQGGSSIATTQLQSHQRNQSGGTDASDDSDDLYVTSRGWLDHQQGRSQAEDEDDEPKTVRLVRPFGHQKSKSLGEILESSLDDDIEKSQRLLEGMHSDRMSESMILRSSLPKIRLELLDIDRFPVWNRRDLEEADEGTGSSEDEAVFATSGHGRYASAPGQGRSSGLDRGQGRVGNGSGSSSAGGTIRGNPGLSNYDSAKSTAELTKILEEIHGTRRKPSSESISSGRYASNRNGSGSNSNDSSLRFHRGALPAMDRTTPRRMSMDYSSSGSRTSWDGPYVTCRENEDTIEKKKQGSRFESEFLRRNENGSGQGGEGAMMDRYGFGTTVGRDENDILNNLDDLNDLDDLDELDDNPMNELSPEQGKQNSDGGMDDDDEEDWDGPETISNRPKGQPHPFIRTREDHESNMVETRQEVNPTSRLTGTEDMEGDIDWDQEERFGSYSRRRRRGPGPVHLKSE